MNNYQSWLITIDLYKKWYSKFLLNNSDNKLFIYKNFNFLNITYLGKQDNEIRNEWIKRIHYRLNGIKIKYNKYYNKSYFIYRFLGSLFFELIKLGLINLFFKKYNYQKKENTIFFHSLSSNLRTVDGICLDRHFSNCINLDSNYDLNSVYLITIIPSFSQLINFRNYAKELTFKLKSLNREYVILNNYLSFKNIFLTYFVLFKKWFLIRQNSFKLSNNKTFEIDQIDFSDIILKEIENSFFGEIQFGLFYGLSFRNFFNNISKNNIIITYGETLSPLRAVYHLSNKIKNNLKFISIQHAINNRNKMALFHRKIDFMKNNNYNYLLIPDYYLLHGLQSKNITTNFYPKSRIKVIGCLKYDDFPNKIKKSSSIKQRVYNVIGHDDKKILLITPSLSDYKELILLFSNINSLKEWRIILSLHPATSKQEVNQYIVNLNLKNKIEIFEKLNTNDLSFVSDLILCGYSSSVYEAIALGKKAVQYCEMNNPPLFEPDNNIPFFQNKIDFWRWFDNNITDKNFDFKDSSEYVKSSYFYKIDGRVSERLWKFVHKIKSI